jgi:hypothetical protein
MSTEAVTPIKRPESLAGVLGAGAVIVIALATGLSILGKRARVLDPAQTFAGWFEPATLPFGLQPVEAARQADGEVLLRLADPAAAPEPEPPEVEPAPKDPKGPPPRFDWSAIAIGPEGTPPREGLLVTWPLAAARAQLESLFSVRAASSSDNLREQSRGLDPLAGLGPEGGRRVLASGTLAWGEFESPYVHERKFEPGGTFVDTLRVNLSGEREALVLFLRWPRGSPASQERALETLASLKRVAPAQEG